MKKIKFNIKEYYVFIASLIIGIPLIIFFYSVMTPKEFMGYLTFVTAFAILPIGMIYWFLSEIKSIFPGIKGLTKLRLPWLGLIFLRAFVTSPRIVMI